MAAPAKGARQEQAQSKAQWQPKRNDGWQKKQPQPADERKADEDDEYEITTPEKARPGQAADGGPNDASRDQGRP